MQYDSWFDSDENRTLLAICTRKLIKNIGIGGIIWGLLNIGIGVVAIQATLLNVGILILGLLMLGTGVQALRKPSLGVLLAETIVTVFLFLWNLGIAILNGLVGEPPDPRGIIFPLIFVIVFAGNYRKLRHLRELISRIPPEKIQETKQVCKTIVKRKLKDEPLLVQSTDRKCRAQLFDTSVFFIQRDLMRAFVASQDAVRSAIAKPEAKSWTLVFNHPLGKLKYRFDKKNTEKLKAWLFTEHAPITPSSL